MYTYTLLFPTLLFSGFLISFALLISWMKPGLDFEASFREKPWRRKIVIGLAIYILLICAYYLFSSLLAVFHGSALSRLDIGTWRMIGAAVLFLLIAFSIIVKIVRKK